MNRVFITGDKHGNFDFLEKFCEENNTDRSDYLIILGDAGINYYLDKRDKQLKEKISKCPITLLCVHGNHEERPWNIKSYSFVDVGASVKRPLHANYWVEKEYPNIIFLMDGFMYLHETFFYVLGGAYSIDKDYRLAKGWKWFKDEQMPKFMQEMFLEWPKPTHPADFLYKTESYDYILSHTAPLSKEPTHLFLSNIDQSTVDKSMEEFLEKFKNQIKFKKWFFGHYHSDEIIDNKFRLMYNDIIELDLRK